MGKRATVEARGALDQGQADGADDEHAKKGHLETGSEELTGIKYEQAEGGCAQCIDHTPVAVEQARDQKNGTHQRGSPHRGTDFG
ncbi:MAG: hypothetical protein WBV69_11560 [Candidatus Sulfotelmatobacter sp.]